jgi:hypothetical protein
VVTRRHPSTTREILRMITPMITIVPTASMSLLLMVLLLLPLAIAWAVLLLAAVIVYGAFPSRRLVLMKIVTQELTHNCSDQWDAENC